MLSRKQFSGLSHQLHDPNVGGFSVNMQTGKSPSSGIMVSDLAGEQKSPLSGTHGPDIEAYARANKKHLAGKDRFMGGWANKGTVYLDRSTRFPATPLGRAQGYVHTVANNQRAAYDIGADSDVFTQPGFVEDKRKAMRMLRGENVA